MTTPQHRPVPAIALLFAALLVSSTACTPSRMPTDDREAGVLIDAGDAGSDVDAGPCTDEGYYYCAGLTHHCCRGVWVEYYDGPCWPFDMGVPDCTAYPGALGCPCAPDRAGVCPAEAIVFGARRDCVDGVWTWSARYACCN